MSILANLLKKAETSQARNDIPPGLLQTVSAPKSGMNARTKYLLAGGVAVCAVALGSLLVIYMGARQQSRPPVAQQRPVPQPVIAVQKPVSSVAQQPVTVATADKLKTSAASVPAKKVVKQRKAVVQTAQAVKQAPAAQPSAPAAPPEPEKKVVPRDRSSIDAYLFAARNAEARRDYLTALRQYQKALDADPHNYKIMNNVASSMLQLNMPEEALQVANRALSVKPDYVSAMVNAGIAHGRLGHASAARGMFAKAVVVEPSNRSALYNLALSQERAGALDDAVVNFKRLASGGDPQGFLGLGRLAEQRGNKGDAIRYYRELTALPDAGQRAKEQARERIAVLDQ